MSNKAFVSHEFNEDAMHENYNVNWIPLTINVRTDVVFRIERNFIELRDNMMAIGELFPT